MQMRTSGALPTRSAGKQTVRDAKRGEFLNRWWNINTRHPAKSRAPPDAFVTVMRQRQDTVFKEQSLRAAHSLLNHPHVEQTECVTTD